MSPQPKIILGDAITGFGGSSIRQAYAIYNEHTHEKVSGSCYNYNLHVGMLVSGQLADGSSAFQPNTRITEVGADYFRVNTRLVNSVNNLMVVAIKQEDGQPQISANVENCRLDTQNQVVWVPPTGGEIASTLARAAELKLITGTIDVYESMRDAITTVVSHPQSSIFNVGVDTYVLGSNSGNMSISTPVNYISYAPVLVNPPICMALYEMTGMLTHPNEQHLPDLLAKVYLRHSVFGEMPGTCIVGINSITSRSKTQYSYSQQSNITVNRGHILYAVVEMLDKRDIPVNLKLHYTLSLICLDEPR